MIFYNPTMSNTDKIKKQQGYEVGMNIRVHKDTLSRFVKLHKQYEMAIFSAHYTTIDQKDFFTVAILFYKNYLEHNNTYYVAPANFIASVGKKGKRKATDRTHSKELLQTTFFGLTKQTYQYYFDVMFSFLKTNLSLDPTVFSVSYFFYDFIDFIEKHLPDIIKSGT